MGGLPFPPPPLPLFFGFRSILRAAKTESPVPRHSMIFLCSETTRKPACYQANKQVTACIILSGNLVENRGNAGGRKKTMQKMTEKRAIIAGKPKRVSLAGFCTKANFKGKPLLFSLIPGSTFAQTNNYNREHAQDLMWRKDNARSVRANKDAWVRHSLVRE